MAVLELKDIDKVYLQGDERLEILRGLNLIIHPGQMVGLTGRSGSGKSTLLHIAGLLDEPSDGSVIIDGVGTDDLSDDGATKIRRHHIGMIYQHHHLLPDFSAAENVIMPQLIAGIEYDAAHGRASDLLSAVGLGARINHRPNELSGGEKQRVAICRALANHPKILLADEPTGNLDPQTSDQVFDLLLKVARDENTATLIATHDRDLAGRLEVGYHLRNGQCEEIT